jgi:hypothetical protein
LPVGSHHWPGSQSAELTAGVTIVTAAIDANVTMTAETRRRTNVLIADLPNVIGECPLLEIQNNPQRRVNAAHFFEAEIPMLLPSGPGADR